MRPARLLLIAAALFVPILAVQPGCSKIPDGWPEKSGPRVVTSFAPIHCFALNVAGDDATVQTVMSELGPHGFDPTPRDIVKLERADLFLINGLGLDDDIAKKMTQNLRNPALKQIVVSSLIPEKTLLEGGVCREGGVAHSHGKYDPHVWLGIPEAIQMVERIRDALSECDPDHATGYTSRAAAYIARLKKLEAEGKRMLTDTSKPKKIITFHDSLRYFGRTFNIEISDSVEPSPGSEASHGHLDQLIKLCRQTGIRVITTEPQYPSTTSAETLVNSLKSAKIEAELVKFDTIETARPKDLANLDLYEQKMRQNLRNLAEALR